MKYMTYRDLYEYMQEHFTNDQLSCHVTIEVPSDYGGNECYMATLKIAGEDHDCLDEDHPVFMEVFKR
jgi:hypothetical protein